MDISNYNIEQCDAVSVLAAIMDMHDHPQKIDQIAAAISPIAAAAAAYSEGKPQLAQAITTKGVTTAADASLATMARNVGAIVQQQTIISGGDAYKQQLFSDADPTKAVLWDLYQVLAQMKTLYLSGESSYTGLLVCEYDKSLDAVDLDKASAWVCSDMIDKTTPILSTDDTHHVWNDANDGKANRWICFLYTNSEGGTFTITSSDAALSPLSIYVGGHIRTIEYQTNGKLTELVSGLTENDWVDNFVGGGYTQNWERSSIINAVNTLSTFKVGTIDYFIAKEKNAAQQTTASSLTEVSASYIDLYIKEDTNIGNPSYLIKCTTNVKGIKIKGGKIYCLKPYGGNHCVFFGKYDNCKYIHAENFCGGFFFTTTYGAPNTYNLEDVMVGEADQSINIKEWNPTTVLADANKTATLISNIRNHILARVQDRVAAGLSTLTFTISQNMYNAITAADTNLVSDFAAKGWNLTYA